MSRCGKCVPTGVGNSGLVMGGHWESPTVAARLVTVSQAGAGSGGIARTTNQKAGLRRRGIMPEGSMAHLHNNE